MTGRDLLRRAIAENAGWCGIMVRAHGGRVARRAGLWIATGAPPFYPEVITLTPEADPVTVRPQGGVKDSFARCDLAEAGFVPAIAGQWLGGEPGHGTGPALGVIRDAGGLADWEAGWRGGEAGATRQFPDALLSRRDVRFVALAGGRGGAILHRASDATGVSNLWGDDPETLWRAILARAGSAPLVGWESGDGVRAAGAAGLTLLGPLTVWVSGAAGG